jgi:hypothetical protein
MSFVRGAKYMALQTKHSTVVKKKLNQTCFTMFCKHVHKYCLFVFCYLKKQN